jgi:transporter family protein
MLSKVAEVVLFLGPALYFLTQEKIDLHFLFLALIASVFTFLNYFFLSSAYARGNLSIMYPISRSSLLFLPFLSWFFIDERVDAIGGLAIVLVVIGTLFMILPSFNRDGVSRLLNALKSPATVFAILAAFTVALYTLWDKIAIQEVNLFLYLYLYTAFVAVIYTVYIIFRKPRQKVMLEWKTNAWPIIQVGFFNVFTYVLVLVALVDGKVTYIGGIRQLSVVVGVMLAYRFLGERMTKPAVVGLIISLLGSCLFYFSA